MRAWPAILLLVCGSAGAEEIRIEVARGAAQARLAGVAGLSAGGAELPARPAVTLSARAGQLLLDGKPVAAPLLVWGAPEGGAQARAPLRLDARELPGRVEVFVDNGALVVVNALDLEDYVAAVVASEVPASWPESALRAQAVAARTFAVAQKIAQGPGARAHLGASVLDQVYKGSAHPQSGALKAARATAGEVLTWGAAPIAAYFSASCGGVSESAESAFHGKSGSTPYLRGGDEDDGDPGHAWTVRLGLDELSAVLRRAGRVLSPLHGLQVSSRSASGRVRTVQLATKAGPRSLPAVELRQLVGYTRLPSLLFDVEVSRGAAVFKGHGSGHGVGLCQWGARGRASRGETYRQILAHYYPGAELRRMY